MSLTTEVEEQEQNEMKDLQEKLVETAALVRTVSSQLADLRNKVRLAVLRCAAIYIAS